MEYRIEHDSMGEMKVPADRLWAAQTQRSHENFEIGVGIETMPAEIIHAFGVLKKAAAITNNKLRPEKMTDEKLGAIKAACDAKGISSDLRTWLDVDRNAWYADDSATTVANNSVTYVYYYRYKLTTDDAAQTAVLFNKVTIPGEFEQEDMRFVSGDFSIKVKAEALQADNTGDNAVEAFANVGWTAGTEFVDKD